MHDSQLIDLCTEEEMRNCYDLATAQKNERENQQVQDTPVNENLVLSGKLVVSTDRVHAHVDVKVDDLKSCRNTSSRTSSGR